MINNNSKITYGGTIFLSTEINGKPISAEEHLRLHQKLEIMIAREEHTQVEELERAEGYPRTWLNYVISKAITKHMDERQLDKAKNLAERFSYRGYGEEWTLTELEKAERRKGENWSRYRLGVRTQVIKTKEKE